MPLSSAPAMPRRAFLRFAAGSLAALAVAPADLLAHEAGDVFTTPGNSYTWAMGDRYALGEDDWDRFRIMRTLDLHDQFIRTYPGQTQGLKNPYEALMHRSDKSYKQGWADGLDALRHAIIADGASPLADPSELGKDDTAIAVLLKRPNLDTSKHLETAANVSMKSAIAGAVTASGAGVLLEDKVEKSEIELGPRKTRLPVIEVKENRLKKFLFKNGFRLSMAGILGTGASAYALTKAMFVPFKDVRYCLRTPQGQWQYLELKQETMRGHDSEREYVVKNLTDVHGRPVDDIMTAELSGNYADRMLFARPTAGLDVGKAVFIRQQTERPRLPLQRAADAGQRAFKPA